LSYAATEARAWCFELCALLFDCLLSLD